MFTKLSFRKVLTSAMLSYEEVLQESLNFFAPETNCYFDNCDDQFGTLQ